MTTPGAQTKARILAAASAEFAAHGLAGARIDRIASAAGVNKERIYAHIGDKRALFGEVVAANLAALAAHVSLDPHDLAESAGRIFDHVNAAPDHLRILDWARLEGADDLVSGADRSSADRLVRLGAVEEAQRAGVVRTDLPPGDIVVSIFALATGWLRAPAAFVDEPVGFVGVRRAFVVDAVRSFLAPVLSARQPPRES